MMIDPLALLYTYLAKPWRLVEISAGKSYLNCGQDVGPLRRHYVLPYCYLNNDAFFSQRGQCCDKLRDGI